MIIVENLGSTIIEFGRDTEGNPYQKVVSDFKPYFYAKDERGTFRSIFSDKLRRIPANLPSDIQKMREKYEHFEADIPYTTRYLIDRYDGVLEKESIRKVYFDIETDSIDGYPDVENPIQRILSIAVYDSSAKKIEVFVIDDPKKESPSKGDIYRFVNEYELLTTFIDYIRQVNPDLLIAWNIDKFDGPYLLGRMNKLGINISDLSRMGSSTLINGECRVKGRVLFDLLRGYRKISQGGRESYSLEYCSQYELGEGKQKYEGHIKDFFYADWTRFVEYNIRDVELMVMLDEKLRIVDFFDEMRRFARCHFLDVFMNSRVIDSLILGYSKGKWVLPSKHKTEDTEESFEGAFVFQPKKGFHHDVAIGDLKSLYPSIMMTFNLSPETYSAEKEDEYVTIDEKYHYRQDTKGMFPDILGGLLSMRAEYKKKMKSVPYGSDEYKSLDMGQWVCKIVANSVYGVEALSSFRLYHKEVAESITSIGRQIWHHSQQFIEKNGCTVILGDTDSCAFLMGGRNIEQVKEIIKALNKDYENFVKPFRITKHYFEMQFEKVFKTLIVAGVKKRYAGLVKWKDGKEVDEIIIKGFEEVRSDSPQVIRDFQKTLFEMILREQSESDCKVFVKKFTERFLTMREEIGIPTGIQKRLSQYEKNIPIHIRAASLSNQFHKTNFGAWDKIKFLYVKKVPNGLPFHNVIAFKDKDKIPEGYEIDYPAMKRRLLDTKIETIYDIMGWEIEKNGLW